MTEDAAPSTRRITDHLAPMVEDALARLAADERVSFDVGMAGTQTGPVFVIGFWMPSGMVGTYVHVSAILDNAPSVEQEHIDRLIPSAMETLRAERAEVLRSANGEHVDRRSMPSGGIDLGDARR